MDIRTFSTNKISASESPETIITDLTQYKPGRDVLSTKVIAVLSLVMLVMFGVTIGLHFYQDAEWKRIQTQIQTDSTSSSDSSDDRIQALESKVDGQVQQLADVSSALSSSEDGMTDLRNNITSQVQKIDELSTALNNSETEMQQLQSEINDVCPIKYNDKCFWVGQVLYKSLTLNGSRDVCEAQGAKLADIYSREHYYMLLGHLSTFGWKDGYINAWIGLTYDAETNSALLSNGTTAPFVRWYAGYPVASFCCGIILRVTNVYSDANQHLHNSASDALMSAAICEK